ncbi:modification methylase [Candidatus Poribacteria bacterium]|nr:MAG: modification methylase [Candidatus Poribacteria bacterium]
MGFYEKNILRKLAKSPLRYPGGKSRAIKQILPLIPHNITEYREPFVGGGSVFFAIRSVFQKLIHSYWINDLNYDLYCFWKQTRDNVTELVDKLIDTKIKYDNDGKSLFDELARMRDTLCENKQILPEFERAVRYFILNRITFSGIVDSGGYSQSAYESRFTDSSISRVKMVSPYLSGVNITCGDYVDALFQEGENVYIFLDPPYWKAKESKLYGAKGSLHTSFDHIEFAENMKKCPHKWLITYDDSPKIRELFNFADIQEWTLQYGMNNYKKDSAAKGNELFIKNY